MRRLLIAALVLLGCGSAMADDGGFWYLQTSITLPHLFIACLAGLGIKFKQHVASLHRLPFVLLQGADHAAG